MSKTKDARVIPGAATPTAPYFYQRYDGKSGSASARNEKQPERRFAELQNLHVPA